MDKEKAAFIAHRIEETGEEEPVAEHLRKVMELCGDFAGVFGYEDWGRCAGLLHDIGKFSAEFLERINGSGRRVDHSTAGAQVCWEKGGWYQLLSYCIAGHHAGLPDMQKENKMDERKCLDSRIRRKVCDYSAYKGEIEIPQLETEPPGESDGERREFTLSVFVRMLYSCLVDADLLKTEEFMSKGKIVRNQGEELPVLLERLKNHVSPWLENYERHTVNGRRSQILRDCMEKGRLERGLYRLTVPTGGGKTIASLAFALRHAVEHGMKRIIYVIPYTSIIEQNAAVFKDILGEENVLECHCEVDYGRRGDDETVNPMLLASENWDKPVVVTTNVQFFESLFGNRSSKCRKLHNVADSVIILDEAQMLPDGYLKPCVAVLEQLIKHYKSTAVLCTATQPALDSFFREGLTARELCSDCKEQFAFFKRANVMDLGRVREEDMAVRLKKEKSALCIVNTKKQAQDLYQLVKGEGVYHLSTFMYPRHRKRTLEEIKDRLKEGKRCVVVSTSLVEAGVDLDFKTVFRQISGLDSILQAMGRCNRNGKEPVEECFLYIFSLGGKKRDMRAQVTELVMEDEEDCTSLVAIEAYFRRLYHYKGVGLDIKGILERFSADRVEKYGFPFATVAREFKLIENNTKTIFVVRDEQAREILEQIRQKGGTIHNMRAARQYCVKVYENIFRALEELGKIRPVSEDLTEDFFELTDRSLYDDEMGLKVNLEMGVEEFM